MVWTHGKLLIVEDGRLGPKILDRAHTCRVIREATGAAQIVQVDGGVVSCQVQGGDWETIKGWFLGEEASDGD